MTTDSSSPQFLVLGAGVLGRAVTVRLAEAGCRITLVEAGAADGSAGCSWVGAGMLAPWCERESSEPEIAHMGMASIPLWKKLHEQLDGRFQLAFQGSLVVAHGDEESELAPLRRRVGGDAITASGMEELGAGPLAALEPELADRFRRGLFFPHEGHVHNREFLEATSGYFKASDRIQVRAGTRVSSTAPGRVELESGETLEADAVVDCRGLGAREDFSGLRGVRGELIHLHAPEVHLLRPVRLMHPRYPLYVVPRREGRYVIGATQVESESRDPITVRSALELLSAAYAVHTGFAEATVLETLVQWRPAFPDHLPRVRWQEGLVEANGLFRHGFLLAPFLAEAVAGILLQGRVDTPYASVLHAASNPTPSR